MIPKKYSSFSFITKKKKHVPGQVLLEDAGITEMDTKRKQRNFFILLLFLTRENKLYF